MYANVLFPIHADPFTYTVPEEIRAEINIGSLVKCPFKKGQKTGTVVNFSSEDEIDKSIKLKPVKAVLQESPLIPENILNLSRWVSQYYMSSFGMALKNAVPSALFSEKKAGKSRVKYDAPLLLEKEMKLTGEQNEALALINSTSSGVFLLHGVTGCGKTEVYINAIKSLPAKAEAIVLVPEISITAQMVDRFRSRFGDEVAFYHSGISTGERITLWKKMEEGSIKVIVGVRSAVFAPFQNLGVIIVDEEHEASYKQFDGLRYHARDVALARGKLEGIKVVLGSATPSMEAFYHATEGKIRFVEIKHRIDNRPMPEIEIVDMSKEEKETFSFSKKLLAALKGSIERKEQSILMLNRRGYSPFSLCVDCGHTHKCPSCSITMIYHKDTNTLNCHYCGSYLNPVTTCPKCKGTEVKYLGTGTQRIEEEVQTLVPEILFQRMDRDTTQKKLSHYRIVKQMEEKKIDMLMGTQMVAKGHDFPAVTLSAVVSADITLNLPDFRSAERAFQLFTQLAGRSGRGDVTGKALIQTYEADHYVFDYVLKHDYKGFFEHEIAYRKELSYPPFSKLIRIILSFKTKERAKEVTGKIAGRMKRAGQKTVTILGPSPAPLERIRNMWRWHIVLKGSNARTLRMTTGKLLDKITDIKDVKVDIDVDPINLL